MADTITQIGLIAGEIWHFIDDKGGESTISEVLNSLNHPREFTLLSLGWLTREGQVFLEDKNGDFKVTRKKFTE
jgi:hypothetical protein